MGASQQTGQTTQATTNPYAPTQPMLQNIINSLGTIGTSVTPQQASALSTLEQEAGTTPSFANPAASTVSNLFGYNTTGQQGLQTGALNTLEGELSPYTSSTYTNPYSNPALQSMINTTNQQIMYGSPTSGGGIAGQFAAAGRDLSPAETSAAAYGESQADNSILANQYNTNVATATGAANTLFGGANTTANALTQQQLAALGINTSGLSGAATIPGLVTAPGSTEWTAAQTAYGAPYGNISSLESLIDPIAALGGQSTGSGTATTTSNPSLLNYLGAGLLGLSLVPNSDERLKNDYGTVGLLNGGDDDPIPLHLFTYKGDPSKTPQVGVMAQEVEQHPNPNVRAAVSETPSGFKRVDYSALTQPPPSSSDSFWPTRAQQINYAQGPTIGQVNEPPYYSEGENEIAQRFAQRDMERAGKRIAQSAGRFSSPEDVQQFQDRTMAAAKIGASIADPFLGAGILGTDFAAHHLDDPNWKEALAEQAAPMAAQLAGGGAIAQGIKYAPKATAGVLGLLGLSTNPTEAGQDEPTPGAPDARQQAIDRLWQDAQPRTIPADLQQRINDLTARAALPSTSAALAKQWRSEAAQMRDSWQGQENQRQADAKKAAGECGGRICEGQRGTGQGCGRCKGNIRLSTSHG